jgi:hypothetical protein
MPDDDAPARPTETQGAIPDRRTPPHAAGPNQRPLGELLVPTPQGAVVVPDDPFPAPDPRYLTTQPTQPNQPTQPTQPNEPISATGFRFLDAALDQAVAIPSAAIHAHVDRIRRRNPGATPAQVITVLEKQFMLAVGASGGAVGAAAAVPAVGTGVALALTASEVAAFFASSAAFALAVADVHGVGVEDAARRRALLMATVLGDQGARTVGAQTGLGPQAWARGLLVNMPTTTIRRVNAALARRMLRRQATRHGTLALGRIIPFGVGAVIGVTGARALGRTVVNAARRAFGPPPTYFPQVLEIAAADAPVPDDDARAPGRRPRLLTARRVPGRRHRP